MFACAFVWLVFVCSACVCLFMLFVVLFVVFMFCLFMQFTMRDAAAVIPKDGTTAKGKFNSRADNGG